MSAVWQKILAGFTAGFLVIRDATVVNLSNNLTVSNVRIVFTFKRRFSRLCKIRKKNKKSSITFNTVDFTFKIYFEISVLIEGFDITLWQAP